MILFIKKSFKTYAKRRRRIHKYAMIRFFSVSHEISMLGWEAKFNFIYAFELSSRLGISRTNHVEKMAHLPLYLFQPRCVQFLKKKNWRSKVGGEIKLEKIKGNNKFKACHLTSCGANFFFFIWRMKRILFSIWNKFVHVFACSTLVI